ncbi:MAG TPA: CPBP family intramembrane glutamic endopeptidase [Thermoanaerobaculia bacterium]|nr:CPBP family intramembrane glutamic endopeptidase [Thermoanaerobaculia bacterium]
MPVKIPRSVATRDLDLPRAASAAPARPAFGRRAAQLGLLVVAALLPTLAAWLYFVVWAHTPWMRVVYGAGKVVQGALPLLGWWVLRMERKPAWAARPGAAVAGLLAGGAVGGAVLAAFAGPLPAWLPLDEAAARIHRLLVDFGAATPLRYFVLALALSVAHSLFEEYYWRWFLLGQLQLRLPLAIALPLASLAFASHHWIVVDSFLGGEHRPMTTVLTLLVAAGGALWGWLFHRYRSLLAPWLAHLLVDGALMTIGYRLVWG